MKHVVTDITFHRFPNSPTLEHVPFYALATVDGRRVYFDIMARDACLAVGLVPVRDPVTHKRIDELTDRIEFPDGYQEGCFSPELVAAVDAMLEGTAKLTPSSS